MVRLCGDAVLECCTLGALFSAARIDTEVNLASVYIIRNEIVLWCCSAYSYEIRFF